MSKDNLIPDEDKMPVEVFLSHCKQCASKPKRVNEGISYLYGIVYVDHLYLDGDKIDLFNRHFPLIVIDTDNNVIKLWGRYGPKVEVNGEFKYNFGAIEPTYVIKGLLCPED